MKSGNKPTLAQIESEVPVKEGDNGKSEEDALSEMKAVTNDRSIDYANIADISLKYVLFWGVILGLFMNWMAMYLKISMGFVSVGIGPMAVLLISRKILSRRNAATRKNLTTILIAYGATQAAEASVGILFLLWLATNASFFGLSFVPPWWLLPSSTTIATRTVFTTEWLVPLAVHYFLMLIPGFMGLVFGWFMKDSFIHDDGKYPFPGVLSQNSQVAVLTDESETKGPLFWKVARWGFVISLVTVLIPGLFVIDLSNLSTGQIFGIMLGPVGLALFAAGILIGKPKVSITPAIVSILAYSLLGTILLRDATGNDFYEVFNLLLQEVYFVPAIGIMLGGLILGPLFWSIVGSIRSKNKTDTNSEEEETEEQDNDEVITGENGRQNWLEVLKQNYKLILTFTVVYFIMVLYVETLDILPSAPLWIISILIFWNIIIGGIVNGYLITMSLAKSNSAISPPFIFDVVPIFLAGGSGFTPYVAMPTSETDGSAGIVSSQKLAKMNDITPPKALIAYISGYLATSLTTPIFALMMWRAFGIGTASFPAPAFPVQGAIMASFASRDISSFIDIQLLLIVLGLSVLLAKLGGDIIFGLTLGFLFPPHMAITLAMGGLVRMYIDRKYSKEDAKELSTTVGPGIAVGASFVIPIMIIFALI